MTACNTVVQEGMEVLTSSPEGEACPAGYGGFMLTEHNCNCPTCARNGNCRLQTLANALGVRNVRLGNVLTGQRGKKSPARRS